MCLNDLCIGAVTPPPCSASVPIPTELAKAIKEELKASSDVFEDPKRVLLARRNAQTLAWAICLFGGSGPVPDVTCSRSRYSRPDFTRNQSTKSSGHCICCGGGCCCTGEYETNFIEHGCDSQMGHPAQSSCNTTGYHASWTKGQVA